MKPSDDQIAIGLKLMEDLRKAQRQFHEASKKFDSIAEEVPTGLPYPDGTYRIQRAGKQSQQALEIYSRALRRYSQFILHGIIPEDD